MSTELSLPTARPTRNKLTGRFLKGLTPHNKGKHWDDYLSEESQRRMQKGWKNLDEYRSENGKKHGGRNRRPIVAITDDGKFRVLKDAYLAAEWLKRHIGKSCNRENIGRCCRYNQSRKPLHKAWDKQKGLEPTKAPNTDHRYMGVRWYYESDKTWYSKIRRNG